MFFAGIRIKGPKSEQTFVIGPTLPFECSLRQARDICRCIGRRPGDHMTMQQYFSAIRPHHLHNLLAALHILCHFTEQKFPSKVPCVDFRWNVPYAIENYPTVPPRTVDDSSIENQMLSCIRSGNITRLNELLAREDLAPNARNLSLEESRSFILGGNMMASRIIVQEGVDYHTANDLAGQYIAQILLAQNADELSYVFLTLLQDYTQRVAQLRRLPGSSLVIRQIHQYIQRNCDQKISSRTLADYLHMNSSYLSALFKKETGMTLSAYIRREKINEAKRLLEGSQFTGVEISEALAFSSESYFCAVFKRETGMTPEEYRAMRRS